MNATEILQKYYGHDTFRPGQGEMIEALLAGRDVLGVMPTGAGKSLCYQIPALMLPGITLVVSPLISLMKDQVANLIASGIPGAYINSSLTTGQQREALRRASLGAYKIIYVAPERLLTENFLDFACGAQISLLAVDEAHCVSQWGQDFRPSYLDIPRFLEALPRRPLLGAYTATATAEVKADIIKLLGLREPYALTTGFDRPNLYFSVAHPKDKLGKLKAYLMGHSGQSGIVYCATRKTVEEVCASLRASGFTATRYHAGLEDAERRANQDDFAYDRATIMVATNAFGMGIDKSNVSFVVHYNMPKSMEAYYQEAGRAGRDGSPADCLLLFSKQDVQIARFLIENSDRENVPEELREELLQRDLRRMQDMVDYCSFKGCLRCRILRYFGEEAPTRCGHCGNCDESIQQAVRAAASKAAGQNTKAHDTKPGKARKEKSGPTLFETLRALRASLAQKEKVPPYVIFSNATLWDMADRLPRTIPQFLQVSGVGAIKAAKYGKLFLAEIRTWEEGHNGNG